MYVNVLRSETQFCRAAVDRFLQPMGGSQRSDWSEAVSPPDFLFFCRRVNHGSVLRCESTMFNC